MSNKVILGIAICTEWDEFKNYDWKNIYNLMDDSPWVFDGRNILNIKKLKVLVLTFIQLENEKTHKIELLVLAMLITVILPFSKNIKL